MLFRILKFQSSDRDVVIEDENGKPLQALTVFSESVRYLKESVLKGCRKQNTEVEVKDLKWFITVPALPPDPTKSLIWLAAIEVYFSLSSI